MKVATYTGLDGKKFDIEYDEDAPCISCGLPVVAASMGGTVLCPWCDMGKYRDGEKWTLRDMMDKDYLRKRAEEKALVKEEKKEDE